MKEINLKFISERRQELDITLQEMALTLGFKNASTYLKYEKGDYSFKANHLPKLAQQLRCEITNLFFDERFSEIANKPA